MASWLVPLALGAWLLGLDVAEPWTGSYDANGALFSTVGRNYLRYGLVATRGGQVVNGGQLAPERFRFYSHHPPGLPLALAASFAAFGSSEWSARLVPIACALGAAVLLYVVAVELGGAWAGFFAMLVFVTQPMVAFFGRMPDHEAPGALFAAALVALYLRWRREPRRAWLVWMCAAAFAGVWFAWVVAAVPWLLLGADWLARGRKARSLWAPAAMAVAGALAVMAHIALLEGGLGELWQALVHRLGSRASDRAGASFGAMAFLGKQGSYFVVGYGWAATVAALAWVAGVGRGRRSDTLVVAALAAFGLFNVVGFRQGAYVHIYYQFYLALALALAAGLALRPTAVPPWLRRPWTVGAVVLAGVIIAEGWTDLARIRRVSFPDDELQVMLAGEVARRTAPPERVLVVWPMASSFRQLTYYADRDVTVVSDRAAGERLRETQPFDLLVEMGGEGGRRAFFKRLTTTEGSAPARAPDR